MCTSAEKLVRVLLDCAAMDAELLPKCVAIAEHFRFGPFFSLLPPLTGVNGGYRLKNFSLFAFARRLKKCN